MSGLRGYLLSVVAAAILLSLVTALLPEGKLRKNASLLGSLLMILTVLSPVVKLKSEDLSRSIAALQIESETLRTGVEVKNRELQGDIIKQQCEAYICDKAAALGFDVEAEIQLSDDGQFPYPTAVKLRSNATYAQQEVLSAIILEDLGISKERQEWISM